MSDDYAKIKLENITNAIVEGTGVFDVLMKAVSAQLEAQVKAQTISRNEFTTIYTSLIGSVLQQAISFELMRCKTQAEVNLLNAQVAKTNWDAKTAEIQTQIAEATLRRTDAEVALTSQRRITELAQTDGSVILADSILEAQRLVQRRQADGFLRNAEQEAANLLWDFLKVQVSVGEDFSPTGVGATDANMKAAMVQLLTNAGFTGIV